MAEDVSSRVAVWALIGFTAKTRVERTFNLTGSWLGNRYRRVKVWVRVCQNDHDVLSTRLLHGALESKEQVVWRENDVAQARPPQQSITWAKMIDASLLQPAPVKTGEWDQRSLYSPTGSLPVPAGGLTSTRKWRKPFYKLYFLTQGKRCMLLGKDVL